MSKKFVNLKRLKMSNTQALEHLRANPGIESVVLENSKILSISTFVKRVPTPLLSKNNMADYTQVKLNGTLLGEAELNKLKIGKMNVEHNDTIEVLDGALAGSMFTIKLGLPLNSMVKDPTLLEHLKDLLKKESVSSDVSKYELDTITWIGKDPSQLSENNYLGFFNSRTIGNFETFKEDLKWLPNLKYINLSGSIFSDSISLSDFENVENFSYSFADCIVLQSLIVDKNVSSLEGSFRNCSNLRTITFKNVSVNNANKSFHNCKGVRNLIVENPNMADSRSLNSFSEALISETTFSGEPNNNLITSNILLDALSCSISIDLGGKKRPDLYNLTSTPNTLTEKLILNNTNITSLNLVSSNTNFLNLRQILADNTEDARVLKLAGNNIQTISLDNSSLLYLQIIAHETPPMFIDNSSYYNRVIINGKELEPLEVVELKKGNWVFNNGDMVKILDGPLNNKTFEISDGIIPTRISKMFPDEVLAEYIRIRTNKPSTTDKIRQFEIDAIETFGANSIVTSENTVSWFNGKTVDDWTGLDQIKNLKAFFIKGIKGSFNSISFNSSKITSLFSAFEGCSNLTSINFNGGLPNLIDPSRAFRGCSSLISVNLGSSGAINSLKSTFEGCSSLTSVSLPTSFSLLTNMDKAFSGASSIKTITMPTIMDNITSMNSAFEGCIALSSINHFMSLNSVRDMSKAFYGCASLNAITVPKNLPMLTTLVDAFNGCLKLTSLELNTIPNVIDITRVIENTPLLRTVTIEPTLTKCITPLDITGLDSPGKTISYVKDDSIIYYYQIKYHDRNAYHEYQHSNLDYSKLINLRPLIRNIFPCPNVAQAVAMELNKTVNDGILISDLHTIESLGLIPESSSGSSSWFSGKPIISFEGINHLINLKRFSFSQATSTPTSIDLSNHTKLENMSYAFNGCTKLRSVTLPRSMEFLQYMDNSFSLCENLVNVSMPINLPVLKQLSATFKGCSSLTSIVLPNDMPNASSFSEAFMRCSSLSSFTMPNAPMLSAANSTFEGCSSLSSITFRGDLNELYGLDKIFFECTSLTEVTLPSLNKASTAQFAFRGCTNIEKVVFPELPNITSLDLCFHDCDKLNLIELPAIMPKLTNDLNTTRLDKEDRTIVYLRNEEIESKSLIKYHQQDNSSEYVFSTLDYSRLPNLKLSIFEHFPCPAIAEEVRRQLGVANTLVAVDQKDLDSILFLGCDSLTGQYSSFENKTIVSFKGLEKLRNTQRFAFSRATIEGDHTITLGDPRNPSVTSMNSMFYGCSKLTSLDVSSFDTSKVTDMSSMFYGCSKLTSLDVSSFDTSNVTNINSTFSNCSKLTSLDVSSFDTSKVASMSSMFYGCSSLTFLDVSSFDTSKVTNMNSMFYGCSKLTSLDVSSFDTSKVASMSSMFYGCSSLTFLDVSSFDTSNVTYMSSMFYGCSSLTFLDVSSFDTSKVASMSLMFCDCSSLTSLDVSSFDTSKVTNMNSMFYGCSKLTSLDVSSFDTSNVTSMNGMFSGCSSLTFLDVSSFNTSNMSDLGAMFSSCSSLTSLDLSSFNTSKVTNMGNMFSGCSNLNKIWLPPLMPLLTTSLSNAFLDKSGRTIIYAENDSITSKSQIKYHNQDGVAEYKYSTLDYTNLIGLYNPDSFVGFFKNLELARYASNCFGLTAEDVIDDNIKRNITELGGPSSSLSKIIGNIKTWSFVSELPNLETINLRGNTKVEGVNLSDAKKITTLANSFRDCPSLKTLKLPIDCSNLTDLSSIVYGNSQNIYINLPAKIPKASTTMFSTCFDRLGVTMHYYSDDTVISIKEITYFPEIARPVCSELVNCTDVPIYLLFGDYIESEVYISDKNLEEGYLKDYDFFYNKGISHNQIVQGYIEILDAEVISTGFSIDVTASVSSEQSWDVLTVFPTKEKIDDYTWSPSSASDRIVYISGIFSAQKFSKVVAPGYKYIYICYKKDSSGTVGEDRGKIHSIVIKNLSSYSLTDINKAELDYVTDNSLALPTSLVNDGSMTSIKINGKNMHPSVVDRIKKGEFMMPKHGEYLFEPNDGKFKGLTFRCNYKENMFEEDIFEAEIVK